MAIAATRPTMTTTPTLISGGGETDFLPGRSIAVFNPGPVTVLLGGPDVSEDEGYPLAALMTATADLERGDQLYGLVASGDDDQAVNALQLGI